MLGQDFPTSQMTGCWSDLPVTSGLHYSGRGDGAAGAGLAATPHRSALRRGYESVDCDMPDRLNADLLSGGGDRCRWRGGGLGYTVQCCRQ